MYNHKFFITFFLRLYMTKFLFIKNAEFNLID